MQLPQAESSLEHVRQSLACYQEELLLNVLNRLVKPRLLPQRSELIERILATLGNPPVVDRRIRDLPENSRVLLTWIGLSYRPTWKVGHLVTASACLGHADGLLPILQLLEAGLLFPVISDPGQPIDNFINWIGSAGTWQATVFSPPLVVERARHEPLEIPPPALVETSLSAEEESLRPPSPVLLADGLEWPLRLAAVWQLVQAAPMRLTQAKSLFKRDLARLEADEVLKAPAPDQLSSLPEIGLFALLWAEATELLQLNNGELIAKPFPEYWSDDLRATLIQLWSGLLAVESWDPLRGYLLPAVGEPPSPFPTAAPLIMLLLARCPPKAWIEPSEPSGWLWEHHPSWAGQLPADAAKNRGREWVERFLLGIAYPLQLLEVSRHSSGLLCRLSSLGRRLFAGTVEAAPAAQPSYPQTLMIQPNAEILAYRQGLTPALIAKLSRFARWKTLGPACTLSLTAEQTYRGLESGLTLPGIIQTLNQQALRPVPASVVDLLQRWANKRERIRVYSAATLVEFQSPADLDTAIARGIVSIRVTDRIGLTDDGREPDFRQLRLIGNRDYESRPQQCLQIAADGLTLTVDPTQADLLLEAEISKFAEPCPDDSPGIRRFAISPDSLSRGVRAGLTLSELEQWFDQRCGQPVPASVRLFLTGSTSGTIEFVRMFVLLLPSPEVTDGILQWPETSRWLGRRLGPCAVEVSEANYPHLRETLARIGITLPNSPQEAG
jgi:hypothetical protein